MRWFQRLRSMMAKRAVVCGQSLDDTPPIDDAWTTVYAKAGKLWVASKDAIDFPISGGTVISTTLAAATWGNVCPGPVGSLTTVYNVGLLRTLAVYVENTGVNAVTGARVVVTPGTPPSACWVTRGVTLTLAPGAAELLEIFPQANNAVHCNLQLYALAGPTTVRAIMLGRG